ncbi:MAG: 2-C-methyl-D-erythritol 4-phosphate cytidylyltransferase, partial [Sphingomonas sp.]|nr:2-C-methyl-D-erythritol 4-phosphate cytidylyltransferase [Sphingomonas sp.]
MKTVALIVAAGKGERTGATLPKQYAPLAGRAMLAWSHQALSDHPVIDEVLVVIGAGQEALLAAAVPGARHVTGGATRRESVA